MWPGVWLITATFVLQSPPSAPSPPATAWPDSRPLTRVFQNLLSDLKKLPSMDSLKTLVAGTAGTGLAATRDRATADWAQGAGTASHTKVGDMLGIAAVQGGAAVASYAVGKIAHRPAVTHVGGDLIRAQVLTAVITHTLKAGAGRTRPNGGSRSFPSGHTSASFATAAVLGGHFRWKVAVPAYATASFVAWTRVRDRKHYTSDVVFGATIGLVVGQTITHRHREWTIVPARTAGGVALYVTRSR